MDVSRQPISPIIEGPLGVPKRRHPTLSLRSVTSQKCEGLNYVAAKASNLVMHLVGIKELQTMNDVSEASFWCRETE
jgi:hypothetical protein